LLTNLNVAVFTTKYVLSGIDIITYIFHYEEDGYWQFSGDTSCIGDEDYKIVSVEEIINMDSTVLQMKDLPLGFYAYREDKDSDWEVHKHIYED